MKYFFHSDAGHGWLAVKKEELVRLGIADKVSTYSYERGRTAYLEEDCDASLFIAAKKAAGEAVEFKEGKSVDRSPIRSYATYRRSES